MEESVYKKVLAICIPTYNRRHELEENLNSLLPQLTQAILPFVEVHIFDNASCDDTEEYCQALSEQYPFITYHRRPENIGPDGNFLEILKEDIDAQFYHLMSDDDLYFNDSVVKLIQFLKQNRDCGFVYLNFEDFYEQQYENTKKHKVFKENMHSNAKLNKKQFIQIVGIETTFLSGLVFNHDYINTNDLGKFIGTNWLQTYAFFQSTKNCECNLGFFAEITICKRLGANINYDMKEVFGKKLCNLFKYGYEECGYERKQLMKIVELSVAYQIYKQKHQGKKRKDYRELLEIARQEHMCFPLLVSCAPNFVAKAFHALQQKKKKKASRQQEIANQ